VVLADPEPRESLSDPEAEEARDSTAVPPENTVEGSNLPIAVGPETAENAENAENAESSSHRAGATAEASDQGPIDDRQEESRRTAAAAEFVATTGPKIPTVIVSEVQTSVAPVVAADFSPPKRKSKLWMYVAAAAVIVGAIWGVAGAKRARLPARPSREVAAVQPRAEDVTKSAGQGTIESAKVEATTSVEPTRSAAPEGAAAPTHEPERPVAASEPSAELAEPEVTKVRLEVVPTDSKVALYGKVVEGPLVFDVKKGTRTILEIARPGYVTRRIVLNGKKSFMRIMMTPLAKPTADGSSPDASPAP
jgi:hypothetical protein